MLDPKTEILKLLDDHTPAYIAECFYRATVAAKEPAEVSAVLATAAMHLRAVERIPPAMTRLRGANG